MSDSTITTVTLGTEDYRTQVSARSHEFYIDEPGTLNGGDTAQDPYETLLGALGACKAITVRMYAQRKGWDLKSVRLDLAHSRPNGRGNPEQIDISISFEGDLDEDQRNRLKEIANACPVQKTILGELSINSILEE
ncbi:MAG: OsmC family protein [Phycisphaerales bacterium]|nr:OsmC family protein [Phycisphaerales bacterium]